MNYKHGLCNTRLYRIFNNMKTRCYNPKATKYEHWGGRGITICDEWLLDFKSFYDWSMSHGYTDDLTIDRKNNNISYSPDNCRWATYKIQENNRSNNHKFLYNDQLVDSQMIVNKYGIKRTTFEGRIKQGWSIERALTTPVRRG